jgi:hypothetical protein
MHATFFWILLTNFGFGFKSQGLQDTCHQRVVFQNLFGRQRRFKTNLTLSLILRFNLRLGGYSICSAIFIASHTEDYFWRFKLLRAWAPHSLKAVRKVLGKTHCRQSLEELEDDYRSTWESALLGYEEFGGLLGIDPQVFVRKLPVRKNKSDSY